MNASWKLKPNDLQVAKLQRPLQAILTLVLYIGYLFSFNWVTGLSYFNE